MFIISNDVEFNRGNHNPTIFKLDNCNVWFSPNYFCTTQTLRTFAKRVGRYYNAKSITFKYVFTKDGTLEPVNVVEVLEIHTDDTYTYKFRTALPVQNGQKRQFKYFTEEQLFTKE